jgi:hypothetical protein
MLLVCAPVCPTATGWPRPDACDPTARLALLASDGATSTTVACEQLGRLRRLGVTPTLATVTMGGNDLLARVSSRCGQPRLTHPA